MSLDYPALLQRLRQRLATEPGKSSLTRLELPEPEVMWLGNKTVLRNFGEYPRLLRRQASKVLMYLARELATAASLDGERAIFVGRKDKQSFGVLLQRYLKDNVLCPVCASPDTHVERTNRVHILVCEACGAKSAAKGAG